MKLFNIKKFSVLYKHNINHVYPDRCPYCNTVIDKHQYACKKCRCDIPVEGELKGIKGGYRCVSSFPHKDKFRRALLRYKFKGKTQYSKQFAQIMQTELKRSYQDMVFDVITYVPMHISAQHRRGYNQSELLANELSTLTQIPCKNLLQKKKKTPPQHKLSAKERLTNLNGAFSIVDKALIKNKTILLIDDIVTTGSTLYECAKTIQKAEPLSIYCLTLSRAEQLQKRVINP